MIVRRIILIIAVTSAACAGDGMFVTGLDPATTRPAGEPFAAGNGWAVLNPSSNWFDTLDAGYADAQLSGRRILVFVGADSDAAGREAWETLQSPQLRAALQQFSLVHLDSNSPPAAARSIGVVTLPAIRVLRSDGKVVAVRDADFSVDGITNWLKPILKNENDELTALLDGQQKNVAGAADTNATLGKLGDPDAAAREAAIRLVASDRSTAAKVVELLAAGTLQQRLSAAEILDRWNAPTADIDPWKAAAISPERLAALRAWAKTAPNTAPSSKFSAVDEIDRYLAAPTDVQARAIRERLVLFSDRLLPAVVDHFGKAPQDSDRRRLLSLRYRLVATDRFAAAFPGFFDLVVSDDRGIRRAAAAQLASFAKPEDHLLLTELFTDSDPFVREQSLHLLRSLGGDETGRALIALLKDPDPDVRAAVLDTFAESPDENSAKALIAYARIEQNTDLVVHVVRVLQLTEGDDAFNGLIELLDHPQWRVRGDAAECLFGKISGRGSRPLTIEQRTAAGAALIKRLADPDGYVVSRAASTLLKSGQFEPNQLLDAVQRHPELAPDVIRSIANNPQIGAVDYQRIAKFAGDSHPGIRAVAVAALAKISPESCGPTVRLALADPDPGVRRAATSVVVDLIDNLRPKSTTIEHSGFFGFGSWTEHVDPSAAVAAIRKGEGRPAWMNDAVPDLERALSQPDSRVLAAVALCALGKDTESWPVLVAAAAVSGDRATAARALIWLPWDQRIELFNDLTNNAAGGDLGSILQPFAEIPDDRAADRIWNLLGPAAKPGDLEPVYYAILKLYTGEIWGQWNSIPADKKNALIAKAKAEAKNGAELQRSFAMALLNLTDANAAAAAAGEIYSDPRNSAELRHDALQVLLLSLPADMAEPLAVTAISDKVDRKIAIISLIPNSNESIINNYRGAFYIGAKYGRPPTFNGAAAIVPVAVPTGLTAAPLRLAMKDFQSEGDSDFAGYAGYLLVLTGDNTGYDPLLKAARASGLNDSGWVGLVYRAITKLNDDSQTPVLEEIYNNYMKSHENETREFYWTIRAMTGPNILKLRKKIRDENGLEPMQ